MNSLKYIAFINVSILVRKGLETILNTNKIQFKSYKFDSIQELYDFPDFSRIELVLVESSISNIDLNKINKLKELNVLGIISTTNTRNFIDTVDNSIYINDDEDLILNVFNKCLKKDKKSSKNSFKNSLSSRETEVLKLLVKGKMNKEVAEELHISIHTVVSHRKNIVQKLGIKSTAAMTIYAVANGIIDIRDSMDLM